jgi:hypothetical protein
MNCLEAEVKRFVGVCISAVAIIGLSSCGGDEGGIGSGSGSGDAQKVTDALISSAAESDVTIDEACVSDIVNKLSARPCFTCRSDTKQLPRYSFHAANR